MKNTSPTLQSQNSTSCDAQRAVTACRLKQQFNILNAPAPGMPPRRGIESMPIFDFNSPATPNGTSPNHVVSTFTDGVVRGWLENSDVVRGFRRRWRWFLLRGWRRVRERDRALGMDPRWRIDGVIADRAAFPQRIHDGGVSVVGEHQSLRVSEKSWQTPGIARTSP